jgi:hypothetical protein
VQVRLPASVGGYQMGGNGGIQFMLPRRPSWLHRTMARILLGWEWKE